MSIEEQLIDLVKRIAENSHFVVKVLKKNGVKEEQAYHFVMLSIASLDDDMYTQTLDAIKALRVAIRMLEDKENDF